MKLALQSPRFFHADFRLVDEDREIGRIEGYPGEDFFRAWWNGCRRRR
jgi:hypothetical protein